MLLMGLKDSTKKMVSKGAHVFNQYKVNKILELLEFETHFGRKKNKSVFFHPIAPSEALLSCGLRSIRKWAVGKSFSSLFSPLKSSQSTKAR